MSKDLFVRSRKNPIISPRPDIPWEAVMSYNPGALYDKGKYHLFYRAVGKAWVSKIGHALSSDGISFTREKRPVFEPEFDFEKNGVEDSRITKIKDTYYITYTAYDGVTARLCWAKSVDLKIWQRLGEMIPSWDAVKACGFTIPWDPAQQTKEAKNHWIKAGGIFPERIEGKYYMLFGSRHLWLATSDNLQTWNPVNKPFVEPRPDHFDSIHVEMGPPPLKTEKGWLIIYHGIDKTITYRLGFLLLDLDNPSKILYRSEKPIFEPKKHYAFRALVDILPGGLEKMQTMDKAELDKFITQAEQKHTLPNIIFCNGAVLKDDNLQIYYGIGDTVIGTAATQINNLLKSV